ncbi:hypothetical protein AMTRI_Chr05g62490 [Amborella trichopoda]
MSYRFTALLTILGSIEWFFYVSMSYRFTQLLTILVYVCVSTSVCVSSIFISFILEFDQNWSYVADYAAMFTVVVLICCLIIQQSSTALIYLQGAIPGPCRRKCTLCSYLHICL